MDAFFLGSLIQISFTCLFIYVNSFRMTHSSVVSEFYQRQDHLLNGINLRVSAFEFPPFMMIHKEARGNVTYSGTLAHSHKLIADYFHLRFTYVPVDPAEVEKHSFANALAYQLHNNQVDFSSYPFPYILEISELVDFTYPMGMQVFTLMQQFPKDESRLSAPIKPFNYDVWILVIFAIIAFMITATLVVYTRKRLELRHLSIFEQLYRRFEYVLTIITSKGNTTPREFNSCVPRLMLALWLLSMVVLINAYIGIFTARLAVPKFEPTVDTLEDLAASKTLRMTVELNSDIGLKSLKAESGLYKVFGDTFRKNPELLFTHPLSSVLNVVHNSCVYPGPIDFINLLIAGDFKAHRGRENRGKRDSECRMTTAANPLPYFLPFSTAFQKGSPYTEIYNRKFLLRMLESGLMEHSRQTTFPPIPSQCRPWGAKRVGNTPFQLNDFAGVFVLFVGGVILSIFIFFVELAVFRLVAKNSV